MAHDLRVPIFSGVAHRYLDSDHIINLMSRVQWEVKEVMSQHSSYIDYTLQVRLVIFFPIHFICILFVFTLFSIGFKRL